MAVVVDVADRHAMPVASFHPGDARSVGDVGKRAVAPVAEQPIARVRPRGIGREGASLDGINIKQAIAVVVEEGNASRRRLGIWRRGVRPLSNVKVSPASCATSANCGTRAGELSDELLPALPRRAFSSGSISESKSASVTSVAEARGFREAVGAVTSASAAEAVRRGGPRAKRPPAPRFKTAAQRLGQARQFDETGPAAVVHPSRAGSDPWLRRAPLCGDDSSRARSACPAFQARRASRSIAQESWTIVMSCSSACARRRCCRRATRARPGGRGARPR